MTLKKLLLFPFLFLCQLLWAQGDTIVQLQEVIISDTQLRDFSNTQSVQKLNDSVISKNAASLTQLLAFNTLIYFKENGLGMVSSPSFRGTTAQQTAVLWNGININSQLNGQTDFNTLSTRDFSSISLRAGGGSVTYGSSAIGGTIHLNNELAYGDKFVNEVRGDYGSFGTYGLNYKLNAGTDRFSTQVSISRNASDNDYGYPNGGSNINGQFYNTSLNAALAYKLNDANSLKFYSYVFDGERHFSLILPSETKTKYRDTNYRNLLEWQSQFGRFTSKVKAAFLSEHYKYYQNIADPGFTFGKVDTGIARYDLLFTATDNFKINVIADYTKNKGYGSDIINTGREIGSGSLLVTHRLLKNLQYEAGLRKEVTDNYNSPLLYSAGVKFSPVTFYTVRVNGSKNFRIPTFNDLYWQGSGNTDLRPESSLQAELGNDFIFGNFNFSLTGYYIKLKDMLRWVPTAGVWRPQNTDRVKTYGAEALLHYNYSLGKHKFNANGSYGYTVSEDEATGYQLIYVPYHKATAGVSYSYKGFSAYAQGMYTGETFTRSDNNSRYNMDAFMTANVGAEYTLNKYGQYTLGFRVLNALDRDYQVVDGRQMPGINYNMYIIIKL